MPIFSGNVGLISSMEDQEDTLHMGEEIQAPLSVLSSPNNFQKLDLGHICQCCASTKLKPPKIRKASGIDHRDKYRVSQTYKEYVTI